MVALEVLERYGVELDRRNFEWAGVSALEVLICAYDGREKREEWRRMVEWFLRRGCELSEKLPERVSLEMRERYETNLPMVVEILRGIMEEAVINIVEEMEAWGGCESEGEEGSCGEWSGSECGSEDGGDMETFEATEMVTEIDGGECRKWSDSGCDAGGERSDGEDDGTMKASDLVVCGGEEALVLLYGEEWSTDTETGTECSEEEGLFSDVESAGSVSEYDEEVDEMVVDGEEAKADTAVLEGAVEFEVGDVEMMEVDTCQSPSDHLEQGSIGASESGTARQGRKPSKPRQRVASFITIGGRRHFRRRRARRF
ncbi:hypothetical protein BJ508DRAFT_420062 [Ascobolus immersus RN42]|uniref:Uncharacterized protein n=1 Tax=Ascobolus immersus RN42 TaxID=1160509 RepID=A0A3N4HFQ3_ASCIM|nr:hypothetical protein BJ508DRAFT_420062 [Ascobolus immersus RN42]